MAERTLVKLTRRLCRLEDRFKSLNGGQRSHDDQAFFGETNGSQQLPTPPTTQSRDQQRYCPYPLTEREVFGGGNRKFPIRDLQSRQRHNPQIWQMLVLQLFRTLGEGMQI